MYKAFVIEVDPEKDIGDVLQIARTLGKVTFRTEQKLKVVKIYGPEPEIGYIAVVKCPQLEGRSGSADVSRREKDQR